MATNIISFRAEFENLVSSFKDSPLAARIFCGGYPFCRLSLFLSFSPSRLTSDERLPICTSIFSLHSLGYYTPQRAPRIFPLAYARRRLSPLLSRQSFHGFLRREDGRANSFKSRCGAGNSANPLRIHRAPLANSSLAPNIFLSAHPFTAHPASASTPTIFFGSLAFLFSSSSYFVLSHRTLQPAFKLL